MKRSRSWCRVGFPFSLLAVSRPEQLECSAEQSNPQSSEPAIEFLPLQLYPRVLTIADTTDDMDNRLDSAPSTSDRGSRNDSGSNRGFTGAKPPRMLSSVGVASASSIAEPLRECPKNSKKLLSEALECLREGI